MGDVGVIVEPREDEILVTVASGWRLETWRVHEDWRELVSVVDASLSHPSRTL